MLVRMRPLCAVRALQSALCSELQKKPNQPQPQPAAASSPHWQLLAFNNVLHHSPMETPQMGDEARTTQCLDCGLKTKKADRGEKKKKNLLTHKTHHLQSLGKFLLQSYTMLSTAASQKEHLQNYHGSRSVDVSAGDTGFIGSFI